LLLRAGVISTLLGQAGQLARTGDYQEAANRTQALAEHPACLPMHLYDAACCFALCAAAVDKDAKVAPEDRKQHQDDYAARAVGTLTRAAAAGACKDPYQFAQFQKDGDFAAIRGREDFRKLEADLAKHVKSRMH
jgi:hypothetical protein